MGEPAARVAGGGGGCHLRRYGRATLGGHRSVEGDGGFVESGARPDAARAATAEVDDRRHAQQAGVGHRFGLHPRCRHQDSDDGAGAARQSAAAGQLRRRHACPAAQRHARRSAARGGPRADAPTVPPLRARAAGAQASRARCRGAAPRAGYGQSHAVVIRLAVVLPILSLLGTGIAAQSLDRKEQRVRASIAAAREEQITYLQRVVDIPSSTLNLEGVRKVGAVFRASLDSLGFTTRWAAVPDAVGRAGHLVAEQRGKPGAVRFLLIGHLDTVVDPGGANFVREDSTARAVGGADMKGGDVVILYALKALQAAGALRDLNITIVFTGDEE
ncbi:MAG: hypothetical protein DMD66_01345, partial [Gemmatimonadetes bacterium]